MKIVILFILGFLSITSAFSEEGYLFQSELEFNHDSSIVPGQLENYSLRTNEDVKLLIAFLEGKNFLKEADAQSESFLKEKFLSEARFYDPLNSQEKRVMTDFKVTKGTLSTKIEMEYTLLKNGQNWRETTVYVLGQKATTFAALQFPANISDDEKKELKKGMHGFSLLDEKVVDLKVRNIPSVPKITFDSLTSFAAKKLSTLKNVGNFIISESQAAEVSACSTDKYVFKGHFSTKKGSAIFNFQKLSSDIQNEAMKEKPSDKALDCMLDFYKQAKDNASTYWSERGLREGCLDQDGKPSRQKTCPDSTYKEMISSFNAIDRVDKNLNDFLQGKVTVQATCTDKSPEVSEELKVFSKLNANIQQSFCCSNGSGNLDKGPLFKFLDTEDDFKNLSPAAKAEMCLLKTIDNHQDFSLKDCGAGAWEGVKKIGRGILKTWDSLWDGELIKATGQFLSNFPQSGFDMLEVLGKYLADATYSTTSCMSPYEAKAQICKMAPQVLSVLFGPGTFKLFIKGLMSGASKVGLTAMIADAAKSSQTFQRMQAAAATTASAAKKVTAPLMNTRVMKASTAVLGKIAAVLGKDVTTPIVDMVKNKVKNQVKSMNAKAAASAENIAKALKRSKGEATEGTLRARTAQEITDVEEGVDGVWRTVESTSEAAGAVASTTAGTAVSTTTTASTSAGTAAANTQTLTLSSSTASTATSAGSSSASAAATSAKTASGATATSTSTAAAGTTTSVTNVQMTPKARKVYDYINEHEKALASGNKVKADRIKAQMQVQSQQLMDSERIQVAQAVAKGEVVPAKIVESHEVGGRGRKLGSYDQSELRQKARLAQEAGLDADERRKLMNAGVLGGDSPAFPEFISIETPSGRIPARIIRSNGDVHAVEYLNQAGQSFTRSLRTEELNAIGARASETSRKAFENMADDIEKTVIKTPVVSSPPEAPKAAPDLNSVFDDIEREGRERMAAMQRAENNTASQPQVNSNVQKVEEAKAPAPTPAIELSSNSAATPKQVQHAPQAPVERAPSTSTQATLVEPSKPKPVTDIWKDRVERSHKPDYVNEHGVAKSEVSAGRIVKARVNTMDGVKEFEGELLNGMYLDDVNGLPRIELKYADGVITELNNVMRGKPNYRIDSISIDDILEIKPKVVNKPVEIIPEVKKPLNKTAKQPAGQQIDPTTYEGKRFRTDADVDALNILLKEQRVGERSHVLNLQKEIADDQFIRMKGSSRDRAVSTDSTYGRFDSPNFDPKVYYAHLAEDYSSALNSGKKASVLSDTPLDVAETRLHGHYEYDAAGNRTRVGSARDEIKAVMKKKGKTDQEIKEVEEWMDRYDETIPRKVNLERATAAQASFEKLKPKLESVLDGKVSQMGQSTFEDISKHLKDMMLKPEKKEAAEAALRRIKCSRPEWNIKDSYQGFDLRCN